MLNHLGARAASRAATAEAAPRWAGQIERTNRSIDLSAKAPRRVLVVDDDESIRSTLTRGLAFEGYRTVVAGTGEEGLDKVTEQLPDLVVLDILLPGVGGLEVTRRLRASRNDVPILLLTACDEVGDRIEGLEAGADDYVTKPFSLAEVLARIDALLRRRPVPDLEPLRFADLELDVERRVARRGQREIELSATEATLLQFFMRRPRQLLTPETIIEHVWDGVFGGASNVADLYIQSLRNKLEAAGERRVLHTVSGGFVLDSEER